jgi:hypothetical protein
MADAADGFIDLQAPGRVDDLRFGDMPEPAVQDDDVWL